MRTSVVVVAAVFLAAGTSGCQATIKPDGAAKSVTDMVSGKTGFTPKDVTCPSGMKAKVGVEFDCRFTGPEGPYTAHMRVTKVDGENVEFAIDSKRG
ncbi:DUF4333 domain-containing protein [Mycobacteroides chelonae]|mgnify:CR=1 FL=1|jgi:hypothetical protein|uniref:DUF4333 domain-containing protein n=1 Tax=Mycobacteroides chelonae TaxID=1774 RepID=A0AB73M8U6_MYCCH|nr:DUF4333 domain-containing protein [Mycobacteroides chelonae]MBF9326639.1 DUF4333 domain-containing protein [Mycobacteroides chelonae]MBF9420816.1 DUF4333 domain-containing protein [Mycobacteroides chelonae]MBF9436993.1 DUF4333 domain-containing protein [Mycobacteroides chelonae]MBV6360718.1 DUF4333 domain-containing protein [Mycobacteroides chelonae]MEC4833833.1 DUF4333 domain-containing protein [Mycobacteroides chelonae]